MAETGRRRPLLVVLLDAFRTTYLNEKDTPFLWSLVDHSVYVKNLFNNGGYCERSCFMTGATPETSDNYFAMALMPSDREYKRPYFEPRFNVPSEIRDRLVMTEDRTVDTEPMSFGIESIWDVLTKERLTFEFRACFALGVMSYRGRTTHGSRPLFIEQSKKKDLYYIQLSEVDNWAHKYGCESKEMKGILRWADATVKHMYETLGEPNLLVFGDHGMADVKKRIDVPIEEMLSGFRLGYDYLYLKSSAAIQFWSWNEKVDAILKNNRFLNEWGTFLPSPTPRQAHFIWQPHPYVMISPCHFHSQDDGIKAMHGWCMNEQDMIDEMYGTVIIHDGKHVGYKERGELIDLCPTICDLLQIPYPEKNEGKSLL